MADESVVLDRLALSRAQHLKFRNSRPKSVSDEEEIDAISDWSESDRECCPLSDFESTSNIDGGNRYDMRIDNQNMTTTTTIDDDDQFINETQLFENNFSFDETPLPIINDSTTSTRISFSSDIDKPKQPIQEKNQLTNAKAPVPFRKQHTQPALLPARRIQPKDTSPRRSTISSHIVTQSTSYSRQRKTVTPTPTRLYIRRETTTLSHQNPLMKDSILSPNSSFHSHDDNQQQSYSPNLSQTSQGYSLVPRAYEIKKLFVDDYDYGRLTDVSTLKTNPPRNRQKWGTIVHPPFPLGYQQVSCEQLAQSVERLTSPIRRRDRHTPIQVPSKRYLSVEETDALINRLTKVKTIRSTDQLWPVQRQSRSVKNLSNALKTNSNWKGVGISA